MSIGNLFVGSTSWRLSNDNEVNGGAAHLCFELGRSGLEDFGLVEEVLPPGLVLLPVAPKSKEFFLKSELFG